MKLRKVSVAIVSWNGKRHLAACLPALARQLAPGVETEVLVLDSGSSDGTCEWVRERHPEVRLVASPVNLGFCAGNNRLAELAEGDALVLLNNDTRPRPEWLGSLVEALAAAPDDVAAVAGLLVDWTGERLDFARGVMTFDGHAFQQDFGRPLDAVTLPSPGEELLFACAGNMIVRRDSYRAAGGFDEEYFGYFEDVDLGWRLWLGGERVVVAPDAVVHHRSMATSDLLGKANRGFLFERNAFLTAYKNYESGVLERLLPAILLALGHRTQTLLVQNNPGGEQLTIDPYRGLIADTGPRWPRLSLAEKWRGYGPRDFFRRAAKKLLRTLAPPRPVPPRLTDERTVSQLRAVTQILAHLDRSTQRRRAVQARRRREDREIFERFPLHVIPTYPGDERLFASAAFKAWMGDDLPLVHARLDEVMATTSGTMRTP